MEKKENPLKIILPLFIIWKAVLFLSLLVGFLFIKRFSNNFFGGGLSNYNDLPNIYSWANFDGEHYLSIAIRGYGALEQAFFPLYPGLISFFVNFSPNNLLLATISGILISNLAWLVALYVFYKLLRIDYDYQFSIGVIICLLVFPTSFYFNAVYSESVFFLLTLLTFYFYRKEKYFYSGIIGMLASATRVFGIIIFFSILAEALINRKKLKKIYPIFLMPLGILSYMIFLWLKIGDPLAFYNLQLIVGEQHQRGIVLLPQVWYRYIKILGTINPFNLATQSVLLELLVGIAFFILPIYGYFKKIKLSYLFFAFFSFLAPTIQGSFSSSPRYVIVLFPMFVSLYFLVNKLALPLRIMVMILSIIALLFEAALFLRGYFVA